jgi:hypothetical protein
MPPEEDEEERVVFGLDPDKMTEILCEAATKERTVVEFRLSENADGREVLDTAVEITEYVETLEDRNPDINQ